MVIFRFFGESCLKLELNTFVIHEILIEHQEEDDKWIFQDKKKYIIRVLASFQDRSDKLEKISLIFPRCNPFPSLSSADQDIYFFPLEH